MNPFEICILVGLVVVLAPLFWFSVRTPEPVVPSSEGAGYDRMILQRQLKEGKAALEEANRLTAEIIKDRDAALARRNYLEEKSRYERRLATLEKNTAAILAAINALKKEQEAK